MSIPNINIIRSEAKGFNYQSFYNTVRSFCLVADHILRSITLYSDPLMISKVRRGFDVTAVKLSSQRQQGLTGNINDW